MGDCKSPCDQHRIVTVASLPLQTLILKKSLEYLKSFMNAQGIVESYDGILGIFNFQKSKILKILIKNNTKIRKIVGILVDFQECVKLCYSKDAVRNLIIKF
jgi:hypothetical protein